MKYKIILNFADLNDLLHDNC